RGLQVQLSAGKRCVGGKPDQRAFQFADIAADVRRDKQSNVGWKDHGVRLSLLLKDSDFRLQVRRLDIRDEPPLKAAAQTVFNFRQLLWRTIAGNHDLAHAFVQCVEGVEELFLRALFVDQE